MKIKGIIIIDNLLIALISQMYSKDQINTFNDFETSAQYRAISCALR